MTDFTMLQFTSKMVSRIIKLGLWRRVVKRYFIRRLRPKTLLRKKKYQAKQGDMTRGSNERTSKILFLL